MRSVTVLVHFNKNNSKKGLPWTVHVRGKCIPAKKVVFGVCTWTVFKPEKGTNPRAWVACKARTVTEDRGEVVIA